MPSPLPINLHDLLCRRTVEGERIEYKAGWNPDPILRTLCAFANDFENLGGGYIIIGQECGADGLPVFPPAGIPEAQVDRIQQELLGYCNLIQPAYFPVLSVEHVEGRTLLVLWAPGGQNRPYKAPAAVTAKVKSWHYYIRRFSSTVEAKGADEQELISLAANVPFDDRLAQQAQVSDLSKPLMLEYLREVGSDLADAPDMPLEALGRQMNVIGGPNESPRPKNVGLMCFNETPDRFFPYTQIDVVWFPEGAGGDRFDEKIFKGPLARMTREARVHFAGRAPASGNFVAPHIFELADARQLTEEVFGPILHVVRYRASGLDSVLRSIADTGYGLTLGIHSRIDDTVEAIVDRLEVGNIYVNRNMIGAVVGVQPFGGHGLSGTGPKAGGPHYLARFATEQTVTVNTAAAGGNAALMSGEG